MTLRYVLVDTGDDTIPDGHTVIWDQENFTFVTAAPPTAELSDPTVVAPVAVDLGEGPIPGLFSYNLSAATYGQYFSLTAVPTQSTDVQILVIGPTPDEERYIIADWHVGSDSTTFIGMEDVGLSFDGYPTKQFRPFSGAADGRLQIQSGGDGIYVVAPVTPGQPPLNLLATGGLGTGNLGHLWLDQEKSNQLESMSDRDAYPNGVSLDPAFDYTAPTVDYGSIEPGSEVAALALTNGDTPSSPWLFKVDSTGTLVPQVQPDVFNPPGNGYTITGRFFTRVAVGTALVTAASTDKITAVAHGLSNGDEVRLKNQVTSTTLLPRTYFVVNATTDDFKVSKTPGGSAVNIDANGTVDVDQITADVNDGMYWVWHSNDPKLNRRGGTTQTPDDNSGYWLGYPAAATRV